MTPFYHPTSVLVLDDDPLFLESLDFQFSEEVSCQTFTRPDAAMEHLRAQSVQHPNFARYFHEVSAIGARDKKQGPERPHGDILLHLQFSALQAIIDDSTRQQRVSVAIVDYDMPKMSGVEFCRAIRHLPIKIILLTGKAGLETAISAFNEGLIDCFLQKQDPGVTHALRREIRRLQTQYFEEISAPIKSALALQKSLPLDDPIVLQVFKNISEDKGIVEHYICDSPPGITMRDADGNEFFLLICDSDAAEVQCNAAEAQGAPEEMLQLLRARKANSWFPTEAGHYHPNYAADWNRFTWPAQVMPGPRAWSYSLIRREAPEQEQRRSHRA